jgi:large subunit ribosomal protein L6
MSRIGRLPIPIPDGVKLHVADGTIRVEGPKAALSRPLEPEVEVGVEGGTAVVRRRDDSRRARSVHGLTRKLIANMDRARARGSSACSRSTASATAPRRGGTSST